MSSEEDVNVLHEWPWGPDDDYRARMVAKKAGPELELLYSRRHEWVQADHGDAVEAAVVELYRLTNRRASISDAPAPPANPPTPHYGAFPGERCACPACLDSAAEYAGSPEPVAWPLVDQAHSPLWTGADEAEAGLLAGPGPARTHEWRFWGGDVVVTVETGGSFDSPDGRIAWAPGHGSSEYQKGEAWYVLGAEILRLAGRAQAAEAALAMAEEDRDAQQMTAEEGLEINAELTAILAVLLGEPPPEPCSPGCRTPHLSAKAMAEVQAALGCWRALEAVKAELLAEGGEMQAQEASAGNWVVRQMRELRGALKARGLWRPAGEGEPGGGTAGSAIEAIDRLTAKLTEARASAAHNANGWEAEKRVLAEIREEGRREGLRQAARIAIATAERWEAAEGDDVPNTKADLEAEGARDVAADLEAAL